MVESAVLVPRWALILVTLLIPAGVGYVVRSEVSHARLDERVTLMESEHKKNNVGARLASVETTLGHLVAQIHSLNVVLKNIPGSP